MNVDGITLEQFIAAEITYLEGQKKEIDKRISELRTIQSGAVKDSDENSKLETRLEGLSWVQAKSHKCDYAKDVPADLVEKVRAMKGGLKGTAHHFTASNTEPTLFRFKRSEKK